MLSTVNNDSSVRMDALVRIMYSVDKQFSCKSSFVLNFHQYDPQGTTCKVGVTCWSMQRTTIFTAPIISSRLFPTLIAMFYLYLQVATVSSPFCSSFGATSQSFDTILSFVLGSEVWFAAAALLSMLAFTWKRSSWASSKWGLVAFFTLSIQMRIFSWAPRNRSRTSSPRICKATYCR